jgi:hypothetical protein
MPREVTLVVAIMVNGEIDIQKQPVDTVQDDRW